MHQYESDYMMIMTQIFVQYGEVLGVRGKENFIIHEKLPCIILEIHVD